MIDSTPILVHESGMVLLLALVLPLCYLLARGIRDEELTLRTPNLFALAEALEARGFTTTVEGPVVACPIFN
jgi:hypothetical protein